MVDQFFMTYLGFVSLMIVVLSLCFYLGKCAGEYLR